MKDLSKISVRHFSESNEEAPKRITYDEKVEENHRIMLEAAKAELAKAKRELSRAKENAMQSWLDSKPLIDELEKQKLNLANAQQGSNTTKAAIAELESQLDIIHKSIKSKREDQLKTESMIHEINHALDQTRNGMERLNFERKKEKQMLAKLRQTLNLRKQAVQTLQLTLRAVLLESDAVEQSSAKALQQINHSENQRDVAHLTHENYYALTRRGKEKISQANWRVSVSMEQKLAAESSRELMLSRLSKFYSSRSWSMSRRNTIGQRYTQQNAESQDTIVEERVTTKITSASSKPPAKESLNMSKGAKLQHSRRSGSNAKTIKKKPSILDKMRKCLLWKSRKSEFDRRKKYDHIDISISTSESRKHKFKYIISDVFIDYWQRKIRNCRLCN
ncbi:hypothetical protein VNO77_25327 [Canavalia gladiata]|uniref:Uncharacterized protein n=1 Tax=Canavalia gladiata TaxID=3824 RepID=A0AAN9QH04_CANGL